MWLCGCAWQFKRARGGGVSPGGWWGGGASPAGGALRRADRQQAATSLHNLAAVCGGGAPLPPFPAEKSAGKERRAGANDFSVLNTIVAHPSRSVLCESNRPRR